jgi:hypothetical protein
MTSTSKLRNYTSKVPAVKSIATLEKRLISAGARVVTKFIGRSETCEGLLFQLPLNNNPVTFRLPARVDAVYQRLVKGVRGPLNAARRQGLRAQAERTAWKTLDELVQLHLDMIELGQTDLLESFLSHSYNQQTGTTLYEQVVAGELKLLA